MGDTHKKPDATYDGFAVYFVSGKAAVDMVFDGAQWVPIMVETPPNCSARIDGTTLTIHRGEVACELPPVSDAAIRANLARNP